MRNFLRTHLLGLACAGLGLTGHGMQAVAQTVAGFETSATSAYVRDLTTGTVLLEKSADVPLPPASMSKLMTLLMLFEALEDERLSLDTTFTVSPRAYQMGGSRMFLEPTDRPTAEDLIRGIAVLSGNDATVVVAEGLAGTEDAFAQMATRRARELGMRNTSIANASGWPDPNHLMSKRDLAILAEHIINTYPQYYPYLSEPEFTWNGITQPNRVPLLGAGVGLDGLKTGYTSAAGYSLTGSVQQGERRIIFAFGGLESERARVQEAEAIINWAFRQFAQVTIAREDEVIARAPVWLGAENSVPLVVAKEARILVPAIGARNLDARVVYDGPVPAPVAAGTQLGELVVDIPDMAQMRIPLVAGADVAEGGFTVRAQAAASRLFTKIRGAGQEALN
ncbi:D-alanyl-D-alanine carboxypeptidase family protein [Roseinatronobacter alkalisoli]|uniref:serine-type D-Ala-D-Ala carboxypeptidase n=1 Tax=Roseinatronobacter alkalisoli TaxID=3028235 RepID=A0ABT5T6W9_9RHOB|nr:D-alanyl-D-alanine carboxypeptidase [Roseinatronobacter sp. HJB301]